jgi:hypothetical protein
MTQTTPHTPRYRVGQSVICRDPSFGATPGTPCTIVEIKGDLIIVRWEGPPPYTYGVYPWSIEPAAKDQDDD